MPMDIILVEDLIKTQIETKRKRLKEEERLHKMN